MARYSKQVTLGYNQEGKRIRKRIYADSQQELKRKERELLLEADKELQSNTRFGDYAQRWFEAYKTANSAGTQLYYERALRFLSPINSKRLKDVTRTDVQTIINAHRDAPTQAKLIAVTAKQIMKAAMMDGLINYQLIDYQYPKQPKPEKRALSDAEKKAVKAADLDDMQRLFVDIMFYLGLRPGEARALQARDFDQKTRMVTISRAVGTLHNDVFIKETKTGVVRTIPVPDILMAEVRAYSRANPGFYLFSDKSGNILTQAKFTRFSRLIFAKINEALGGNEKMNLLNGWTMYTFRHNRATELYYLNGVSTKKKAEYMGHSEQMFLQTYSHLDNDREDDEILRQVL